MTVRSATSALLLEREQTLDALDSLATLASEATGSFVVLEGEAGMGKTSVLERAIQGARERGMQVLSARGSELEQHHPLGVVTSLFESTTRHGDSEQLLRGAAEPARALFVPPSTLGATVPMDLLTMIHALYWLTLNLSDRQPLLLAIDDAQWADEASLRYIAYVAERIAGSRIFMVAAMRPGEASERAIGELVRSHPEAQRMALAPLSRAAVGRLIEDADLSLSEDRLEAIQRQSGGNPFYVVELIRAAATSSDGEATIPRSEPIQASVRRRLVTDDELPSKKVAESIAILGDGASLQRTAMLSGASESDVAAAVRRLADREILARDRVAFLHPIIHRTIVDEIPAAIRSRMHRDAARVLGESGGSAVDVATHLLVTEPADSEVTVTQLREAARSSTATGDARGAVRFLRRALDERAGGLDGELLLELAHAEAAAGDPAAPRRYEEAIARLPAGAVRAGARRAQGLGLIQASNWRDAAKAFEAGLEDVDPKDAELVRALEAGYIASAYVGLADHEEADRRLAGVLASPLEDQASRELAAWSAFQQTLRMTGTAAAAAGLALRAIEGGVGEEVVRSGQVVELVAGALVACGLLDEDVEMLTRGIDVARTINAHAKVGVYSYCRSIPHLLAGRLREAIADGETAVGVHESGWEVFYPGTCAVLAWAHLERGEIAAAERVLAIDDSIWGDRLDFAFMHRIARGEVAIARGDLAAGMAQFEQVSAAGEALGILSSQLLADWRTPAAIALRGLGRRREAVETAEHALGIATHWGEPIAVGRAKRALGIAVGGEEGIEELRAALAILETTPARLEVVRTSTELGAALRRAGKVVEARQILAQSADMAGRLGAIAIAERARSELLASGARPRRIAVTGVDALTPSELRVARMAADGRTNREIAQALFVTLKAVEYHLANAYRKLTIEGRSQLPGALGQETTSNLSAG